MSAYETTHPYWSARLAVSIAMNVGRVQPPSARKELKAALEEFIRSGVPGQELRQTLREEMKR